MVLPTSGSLSLSDIAAEFDPDYPDFPYDLSDFYAGGRYVPTGARNGAGRAIPAAGALALSDFYGASSIGPAVAPRLSITPVGDVDEGGAITLTVTPTGGRYDTIAYQWAAAEGSITGAGASARYTAPSVTRDTAEQVTVGATVTGAGRNAIDGSVDRTNSAEGDAETFTIRNVPVVRTRTRVESIYRESVSAPARPAGGTNTANHIPSGWSGARAASPALCLWLSRRTVTERSTDGGPWAFVSATRWGVVGRLFRVAPAYPGPTVNVDAGSGEIIIDVSPPASGWRGECGAEINGVQLQGYTTGLIPNLGSSRNPASIPFASGFTGTFVSGEFVAGGTVSAVVWATYSDGGRSVAVRDSAVGPRDGDGEGSDDP